MKRIISKLVISSIFLFSVSFTASAVPIKYNFAELDHPVFPANDIFSGYYIFDSDTPPVDQGPGFWNEGIFDNPIIEMGFTYQGQSAVFDTCFSPSCSEIRVLQSAEDHYSANATLFDSTGIYSATLDFKSGDLFSGVHFDLDKADFLAGFYNQTIEGFFSDSELTITFDALDGLPYTDTTSSYRLTREANPVPVPVPVPEPATLALIGIGIIGLRLSTKKKANAIKI